MSFVYSFVATKNNEGDEYANFMQSYTSQTSITLTKTNTKKYILNGGYVHPLFFVSPCATYVHLLCQHVTRRCLLIPCFTNRRFTQTFLNFVGVVLHSVKVDAGQYAQFVQVSFTMPEEYQPPGATGPLIPFSSVCVRKGMCMYACVYKSAYDIL